MLCQYVFQCCCDFKIDKLGGRLEVGTKIVFSWCLFLFRLWMMAEDPMV